MQSKKQTWLYRTFQHYASRCLCIESQPSNSIRGTAGTHHLLSPSLSWFYSVPTAVKLLLSPHQQHLLLVTQHTERLSNPFSLVLISCFIVSVPFTVLLLRKSFPSSQALFFYLSIVPLPRYLSPARSLSLTTTSPAANH